LLGAGRVVGVDIDPQAPPADFGHRRASSGAREPFDVVVANILANPLMLLAPALARRVRVGGRIVLSGILASQTEDVLDAYGRWFRIGGGETEEGWVALVGVRADAPHPG
jgi:ribosomal protein L11 methyltransferase